MSITHPVFIKETLTGILFCLLIYGVVFAFPLLGVFVLLFLPLPVLFYRLKLGRNGGSLVAAASFFILMVMARGVAFDTLYFGVLLMTGMCIGECLERHLNIEKTMGLTTLMATGSIFGILAIYLVSQDQTLTAVMKAYMNQSMQIAEQISPDLGMDKDMAAKLVSSMMVILPGMFIVSFMTTIWLNVLLIKGLLKRKGIALKSIEGLNLYQAPDKLVWGVIAAAVAMMIPSDPVKIFGINSLIVLLLIYFFQGIAIISFFFQERKTPMVLKAFCYFLIAAQVYVLIMVIGLGFLTTG